MSLMGKEFNQLLCKYGFIQIQAKRGAKKEGHLVFQLWETGAVSSTRGLERLFEYLNSMKEADNDYQLSL